MSAIRPFHLLARQTPLTAVLATATAHSALSIPSGPRTRRHLVTAARYHGPHGLSYLREHYHRTLQHDLLILTYDHTRVRDSPVFRSADVQALVDAREENELSEHNNDPLPHKDNDSFDHNSDPSSREENEPSDYNSNPPPFETESPLPTKRKGNKPRKPMVPRPSPKTVPSLESITVHAMVKEAITNKANLLSAFMALQSVTAARPEVVYARTSVAPWKLREGMPIGVKVTLRGDSMYNFLDKLTGIVLPGLKEWHGLPASAGDGNGNVAIGLPPSALSLFPEIEGAFDMYPRMTGFDVVFNTTAFTNTDGRLLMSGFSVPFTKDGRLGKKGTRK